MATLRGRDIFVSHEEMGILRGESTPEKRALEAQLSDLGYLKGVTQLRVASNDARSTPARISTTPELPKGGHYVQYFGDDDARNFAVRREYQDRPGPVTLFISDSVKTDQTLVARYQKIKTQLGTESWSSKVVVRVADAKVIEFINSARAVANDVDEGVGQDTSPSTTESTAVLELIETAASKGASDIHVLIEAKTTQVCFRINGQSIHYTDLNSKTAVQMFRYLYNLGKGQAGATGFQEKEIMSRDIALNLGDDKVSYTLRWQSSPADAGNSACKIVIRLLKNNVDSDNFSLAALGYEDSHRYMLENAISTLKGAIIVTGTTGSGKSTLLFALMTLMQMRFPNKEAYTIEDPIEYLIPGATQLEASPGIVQDPKNELSMNQRRRKAFSLLLESLMRQDPDIVMIGEVRTAEVTHTAVELVDTGHKLLTTNHANSILDTFDRLANLGVDRETLSRPGFFSLIANQKLLPTVCSHCCIPIDSVVDQYQSSVRDKLDALFTDTRGINFRNINGCEQCGHTGISGRVPAIEALIPDDHFLQLMLQRDYVAARRYWLTEMDLSFGKSFEYIGRSSLDHAIANMHRGKICPSSVEEEFQSFDYLHATNAHINHPLARRLSE